MIKGMTGFGSTQLSLGAQKGVVEIKSVNHRYLDIIQYLPGGFGPLENRIRQCIQKDIQRGRVTVSIKFTERLMPTVALNKTAIKTYLQQGRGLKKEFGLRNDLTISDLMRLPGVVETKEISIDPEAMWPVLQKFLDRAFSALLHMRQREGCSLARDISGHLKHMSAQIHKIRKRQGIILKEKKKVLTAEEMGAFQKSCDINEETARFLHYVEEVKLFLQKAGSVGKEIDFVAQEMQREVNTIGSKLQDKIVSKAAIALKGKIEKIREQAQNIE